MAVFIITAAVGAALVLLGISCRRGNIELLQSYHRERVKEEDRIPFGRAVGRGLIVIGCSVALFGVLSAVTLLSDHKIFLYIGDGVLVAGLILGTVLCFSAIKKYNKGIF